MTDLSGRILSSLSEFDIPDDIHETSDAISSFAFIVNDLNVAAGNGLHEPYRLY